jgi:ubiquitin-like protein ATG12
VKFKSIGSAPIMKTTVFKVTASNRFQAVIVFLRGQLGFKATDPLVSFIFLLFGGES